MTVSVIVTMIVGLLIIVASFFVGENLTGKEENNKLDFMTIDEDYEFSERELRIIKRKIEDVIANHAKEILYETNDSLVAMANEKTMALGDYAVAVCEEIEKNHKEVMFLYSMLDDKQKEIMNTVRAVDEANKSIKDNVNRLKNPITVTPAAPKQSAAQETPEEEKKTSAIDQLSALAKRKKEAELLQAEQSQAEALQKSAEQVRQQLKSQTAPEPKPEVEETVPQADVEEESFVDFVDEEEIFISQDSGEETAVMDEEFSDTQQEAPVEEDLEEEFAEGENSNAIILEMHKNGSSILEIAKQLGLGVGEVKLVIDLYRGE